MAFMTFLPSCKTVELLCGPEGVLMLFRYTWSNRELVHVYLTLFYK